MHFRSSHWLAMVFGSLMLAIAGSGNPTSLLAQEKSPLATPNAVDAKDTAKELGTPADEEKKSDTISNDAEDGVATTDDNVKTGETSKNEKEATDDAASELAPPKATKAPKEARASKGAVDETADLKPAEENAAEVEAKAGQRDSSSGGSSNESFLSWLYRSLGTRYVVIFLIITFNAVALLVMIVLGLRRNVICPDKLVSEFEEKLNEKKYQEAYELCKGNRSFLGKVLAAGMARLPDGFQAAQDAMQDVGDEQTQKLEQRNGYIALIAQIGPMFGLLGTVDGMVMAFDVIAHSNVTPKPSELAQGIGTALVTTVVGLWIAIPSIVVYNIISNRLSRLLAEAGLVSTNLMKRFATVKVPTAKKEKEKEKDPESKTA